MITDVQRGESELTLQLYQDAPNCVARRVVVISLLWKDGPLLWVPQGVKLYAAVPDTRVLDPSLHIHKGSRTGGGTRHCQSYSKYVV